MRTVLIIIICAVCTFAERLFPFAVFGKREIPPIIKYLGNVLPTAVIASLVIYCMRNITFSPNWRGSNSCRCGNCAAPFYKGQYTPECRRRNFILYGFDKNYRLILILLGFCG